MNSLESPLNMPLAIPASDASGSLRCPKCQTRNPSQRRFCTNCGSSLWETCLRCGTVGPTEERFCGTCGADVAGDIQRQIEQLEGELQRATLALDDYRFDEALAILEPIRQVEHPRFATYTHRAIDLQTACKARRSHGESECEAACQQAQQLADAGDYAAALQRLDAVAATLRDEKTRQLCDELRGRAAEVAALHEEIRTAAKSPLSLSAVPKVARLLQLQPGHAEAQRLAGRLCVAMANAARKQLAQHKYEEALKLLDQLPGGMKTAEMQTLLDQVRQRAWLARDLRTAPMADTPLLAVAKRLLELEPADPQATKLLAELQRRATAASKDPKKIVRPWAAAPKQPKLGCRVEWLTGFHRIGFGAGLDATLLAQHPGRFFTAAGLALQGLDEAAVEINLHPGEGGGVLSRVAKLVAKFGAKSAWGLDLGNSGLRAIKLARNAADQSVQIVACDYVEHAKPLHHAMNDDDARALAEDSLRTFAARSELKGSRICLGLPSGMLLMRQLKLPRSDEEKLARLIAHEVRGMFPLPLTELVWAYVPLDDRSSQMLHATRMREVLTVAAKRVQLKDRLSRLHAAGLPVDVVQCDCLALWNFLAYEYLEPMKGQSGTAAAGTESTTPIALLDIGSTSTSFFVATPHLAWLRHTGLAAEQFTKVLTQELQLTLAQAELYKRNPAAAPNVAKLYESLDPVFAQFAQEIERWLAELGNAHRHWHVEQILGCGGGFLMHGLLRHLQQGT
jgi:type IV pilus assembly protein PilM